MQDFEQSTVHRALKQLTNQAFEANDWLLGQMLSHVETVRCCRDDPEKFKLALSNFENFLAADKMHTRVWNRILMFLERTILLRIPAYVKHYASD